MLGITSIDNRASFVSTPAPFPVYVTGSIVPVKPVVGVKVYVPFPLIVKEPALATLFPFSSTPATVFAVPKVNPVAVTLATPSSLVNS